MFQDVKGLLASKTIWGAVIAIAPQIAALFGLSLTGADATDAVGHVEAIVSAVGGLIAIWGRVTATKRVSLFAR